MLLPDYISFSFYGRRFPEYGRRFFRFGLPEFARIDLPPGLRSLLLWICFLEFARVDVASQSIFYGRRFPEYDRRFFRFATRSLLA
jgi:hypothetical protein